MTPPGPPVNGGERGLRWFKVCKVEDLKPGQARSIRLLARLYAVFNVSGEYHAIDGSCRHMKANLAAGRVTGKTVECFMHGWRYDVTTGACSTVESGSVATYPVKIEDGAVFIGMEWPPRNSIDD
ncbi:Rieske 2Fe-2S domain-containing protein [candidate division KSB1 bacterium]|nr:Rieske 2Fe-2S domain-containing protein [candidate division KSB1 bacterium]